MRRRPALLPESSLKGARPARLAAALGESVPSSGIWASRARAVTLPTPGADARRLAPSARLPLCICSSIALSIAAILSPRMAIMASMSARTAGSKASPRCLRSLARASTSWSRRRARAASRSCTGQGGASAEREVCANSLMQLFRLMGEAGRDQAMRRPAVTNDGRDPLGLLPATILHQPKHTGSSGQARG